MNETRLMQSAPHLDDLPHSPAAERNGAPILDVLREVLPATGTVLEIAGGTGQHVAHFAEALPDLLFQPTDRDASGFEAIRARTVGFANVEEPLVLDVTEPWPVEQADAVVCINMIHISPWAATLALLDGASALLPEGAPLFLYGPFRRAGVETASGNVLFDADLKRRDPRWGLRDLDVVARKATARGFGPPDVRELPANNLAVTFRRQP